MPATHLWGIAVLAVVASSKGIQQSGEEQGRLGGVCFELKCQGKSFHLVSLVRAVDTERYFADFVDVATLEVPLTCLEELIYPRLGPLGLIHCLVLMCFSIRLLPRWEGKKKHD